MAKASLTLDQQITKQKLDERFYSKDTDDTEGMSRLVNAVGVSPQAAKNNGCVALAGMLLAGVGIALAMFSAKNFKKLPKQDEVEDFDLGNMKASLIELTDENREHVLEVVISMYIGETCIFCLQQFQTIEDVKGSVYAPWEKGRIAHKACWNEEQYRQMVQS